MTPTIPNSGNAPQATQTPKPRRPGRPSVDPENGESVGRFVRLPAAHWAQLDLLARKLSRIEGYKLSAAEMIRRMIAEGTLSRVVLKVAEGQLAKKLNDVLKPYGMIIRKLSRED